MFTLNELKAYFVLVSAMYLIQITHSYIIHITSKIIHLIKDGQIFHFISSTDDCYLNTVYKILLLLTVSSFLNDTPLNKISIIFAYYLNFKF